METEYLIEPLDKRFFNWREFWHYRELLYFFTWRDIKVKYKQTVLGVAWALLQPTLMVLIFTIFFSRALSMPSSNLPYPVFAFSGLLVWNLFSSGLTGAGNSMVANAAIIKKVYFPRLIIPLSAILSAIVDFCMAFVVFGALLLFYHVEINFEQALLFWPLGLIVTVIATMGPSFWLSALNVKFRDFRYVIPFLTQLLFFVSPVIYPLSIIKSSGLQYVLAINPMYAAVSLFRMPVEGHAAESPMMMISLGSSVLLLLIGLIYFRKTESYFADLA